MFAFSEVLSEVQDPHRSGGFRGIRISVLLLSGSPLLIAHRQTARSDPARSARARLGSAGAADGDLGRRAERARLPHGGRHGRAGDDAQADLPEVVSASAPQTLPSTRAGGQDDVSLQQTPSN